MSNRIEHILVPIDFTEYSLSTVATAIEIANRNRATLALLHVMDSHAPFILGKDMVVDDNLSLDSIEEMYREYLDKIKKTIHEKFKIKVSVLIEKGDVVDSILEVAKKMKSDLIVIGTHGSQEKLFFLGINAYQIIKNAGCTVLTIPKINDEIAITKIIFPGILLTNNIENLKLLLQKDDLAIEILGLNNRSSRFNIQILNETINYLENNLHKSSIHSTNDIQDIVSKISDSLHDLNIQLITHTQWSSEASNAVNGSSFIAHVLSITENDV